MDVIWDIAALLLRLMGREQLRLLERIRVVVMGGVILHSIVPIFLLVFLVGPTILLFFSCIRLVPLVMLVLSLGMH